MAYTPAFLTILYPFLTHNKSFNSYIDKITYKMVNFTLKLPYIPLVIL